MNEINLRSKKKLYTDNVSIAVRKNEGFKQQPRECF